MAQRDILEYPDPRLEQRSDEVTEFDDTVRSLVKDLFDTLYATTGIGLCAPQINDRRRVLVLDLSEDASAGQVFINPEILRKSTPGIIEESCMSVPGIKGNVFRATQIRVLAQDASGVRFEKDLSNMEAVCLQHELDHLNGKLFIDRLSWIKRFRIRSTLATRRAHAS